MTSRRNVLLTCGGRWVGMVCQIRNTLPLVPGLTGGRVLVADKDPVTPSGVFADASFQVPSIPDPDYVPRLLELCDREGVRVLIPLTDVDMLRLAPHLADFERTGTTVVSPPRALVELCFDKNKFDAFARSQGIPVPRTVPKEGLGGASYPLFFKPKQGFGSIGAGVAMDALEARWALEKDPDLVFQECLKSAEISVDGFVSKRGEILHAVQRVRDKVIGGECVRSHTVKLEPIRRAADRVLGALVRQGFHGPFNLQFFESEDPVLFDVNLRLGLGGSALSNVATGGHFFASMLQEASGSEPSAPSRDYEEGLRLYKFQGDLFQGAAGDVRAFVPGPDDGQRPANGGPGSPRFQDLSTASFRVMTEADLAEHRHRTGARIVQHRGHYWEQVGAPGFYQPVNLLGRLTPEEATRPTPLCWGYRAALTPECAGDANGALPILRLADLESYDLDRLSSNRRNKLRKCRRLVKIVQLTGPELLLEQGYETVLDALARTQHERVLSREAYLAETRSHLQENNRCVLAGLIDGRLGGYLDGYVVDGIAYGVSAYYATWALPTCISTGLVFEFAQLCRRIPNVRMLVGGIDAPEDSQLAHFKMDMGFVVDRIPTKWTMNFMARSFLRRQRPHTFYRLTGGA